MASNAWTSRFARLATHGETRELLLELERAGGWIGRRTRRNHIQLQYVPTGGSMTCPGTPGDWRGMRNLRADVRRILTGFRPGDGGASTTPPVTEPVKHDVVIMPGPLRTRGRPRGWRAVCLPCKWTGPLRSVQATAGDDSDQHRNERKR